MLWSILSSIWFPPTTMPVSNIAGWRFDYIGLPEIIKYLDKLVG
jgi:hypothetical protein